MRLLPRGQTCKLLSYNDLQGCKILKIDEIDRHKCLFLLKLRLSLVDLPVWAYIIGRKFGDGNSEAEYRQSRVRVPSIPQVIVFIEVIDILVPTPAEVHLSAVWRVARRKGAGSDEPARGLIPHQDSKLLFLLKLEKKSWEPGPRTGRPKQLFLLRLHSTLKCNKNRHLGKLKINKINDPKTPPNLSIYKGL